MFLVSVLPLPLQMTQEQQQEAFASELWSLIDRYIDNFDLTVSSAIGVLETVKMQLFMNETTSQEDED